ncbi:hypothetical protein GC207_04410 [bacterium]|nr:hypothetical protein [bacterium]
MAAIAKKVTRLKFQSVVNTDHSIQAGIVAVVEAMARRLDLWNKLRKLPCLDPLLGDSHLGSPTDVSAQLLSMIERNRALWEEKAAHFYADWRIKTLLKKLVMLPGRLRQRSRQWVAKVLVPDL